MTCRDSLRGGRGTGCEIGHSNCDLQHSASSGRLNCRSCGSGWPTIAGGLLSTKDFKRRVQIQDVLRGITEMPRRITPNITQIKLTEKTKTFAD